MKLQDFIIKYGVSVPENFNDIKDSNYLLEWYNANFTVALQNFADKLCEKQRGYCGCAYYEYNGDTDCGSVSEAIDNAPQPKIDEL